jgi:REP element-mobilizing transposase RayT
MELIYNIVFTTKYRRKIFFGEETLDIGRSSDGNVNGKPESISKAEPCADPETSFLY